jgi:hypothetical protein
VDDGRGARAEATAPRGGIPLALAPLLSPYRRHGQLSVRVERLPNGARFSKGQNNGDRTWSLRPDELDDVLYQPPEGLEETHTLAVRILSLDGDQGSTLAVLDLPVSPADARAIVPPPMTAPGAPAGNAPVHNDGELRRLRDQLTELTARLAVREAELAEARQKFELAQGAGSKQAIEGQLAAARVLWEAELKDRLAAAAAEATTTLATSRDSWQAEQGGRFAELEKRADEQIQLAQHRWQQDAKAAMSHAEASWKSGEAARLAAAEARLREEWTRALAEAEARVQRAETALAQLRPEEQIQRARDAWQQEARTALARAEESWKANEAARHAASEARWREEYRRSLAETEIRAERAEAALAQARQENAALPLPEKSAKTDEAVRLATTETRRREEAERALAETRLRAERTEAALAQAQTRSSGDAIEIHVLHDELRDVKAALALRETQLADARSAVERRGASATISKQRQLSDQLIAGLKNENRIAAPEPARAGFGRRLIGMVALLLIVTAGVMYYPQIEAAVLDLWQPNAPPRASDSSAAKAKAPLHRPSLDGPRLP